jgi:tetratricopeptide (TPR) repeat protein
MWYGTTLSALERQEESLRELRRAQECDPLSLIINSEIGRALFNGGQYDQAIEHLRKTIGEMDPNFAVAHWYLGLAYEQKSRYTEAIGEFQKWLELSTGDPAAIAALAHAYGVSGNRKEAEKRLAQLQELSKSRYVAPIDIAVGYTGLGDKERTLEWLEKAFEDRSAWLIWIKIDPRFAALRSEPRYRALLSRMGF